MPGLPTRRAIIACAATMVLASCGSATSSPEQPSPRPPTEDMVVTTDRTTYRYGDEPDQTMEVVRPEGIAAGPVVVLLHGGFWREEFRADLMAPLAADLADRGMVAVNVEYRRVGGAGGWPVTLVDVATAVDALADEAIVGPDLVDEVTRRGVVTVGHSAGGHLAVWAASRHRIPDGFVDEVGGEPRVRPCAAVAQAGVVAFVEALPLGGGAVADLLGGAPDDVPGRLAAADPTALVPVGVPVTLVHGREDRIVPVSQSETYAAAARDAGDHDVRVVAVAGDHFPHLDVTSAAWAEVVDAVGRAPCPD